MKSLLVLFSLGLALITTNAFDLDNDTLAYALTGGFIAMIVIVCFYGLKGSR